MTELKRRLGLARGAKVALVNVRPETIELLPLDGTTLYERATEPLDVLVYCSDELAIMTRRAPFLAQFVRPGGTVWLGCPRPGARLDTDITPAHVEKVGAAAGLKLRDAVDVGDWHLTGFARSF